MERSSGPETPLPEDRLDPELSMPPGLRFARGMGIFLIVFTTFFLVQTGVFIAHCRAVTPALQDLALSDLLQDPVLVDAMQQQSTNGSAIAKASLWSGLVALLLLMLLVRQWVGPHLRRFLGLRMPTWRAALTWTGVFILVAAAQEVLSRLFPAFTTDFMAQVVRTADDPLMLVLGIGVLPALFEEALVRGLLYGSLRQISDEHVAVALSAGTFTLMHMQYPAPILLLVLMLGVVLGYARSRTGSIWVPVGLHMLNNLVSLAIA